MFVIYRCTNDAWEGESMTRMGAVRALLLFAAVIGLCHRNLSKGLRVVCLNARGLLSFTLILNDGIICVVVQCVP